MHRLIVLVLIATLFAGCTGSDDPAPEGAPTVEGPSDGQGVKKVSYEVDETNETQLEGAHLHDEWGEATMLQLADLSVPSSACSEDNPFMELFLMGAGVFRDQEVHKGCALFAFDEGKIVPEGTARIYVDIDASQALPEGGMRLSYGNEMKRFTELEGSSEPIHSWTIEMEPVEWDLPHSTETAWFFFLQPSGQVAILDGNIKVVITAERQEDWKPILGSAHADHWDLEEMNGTHAFIGPHVIRSLDTNVSVVYPSFAERIQDRDGQEPFPLDDIIPPGTTQVTLAVQWQAVDGCPPSHGCWVVGWLAPSNGGGRGFSSESVEIGADWAIYVYDVPEPMAPDSTYAETSVYTIRAFVRACPNGEAQETPLPFFNGCMGEAVATMTADTRFEVESWKDGADLQALKTRLGFS